MLGQSIPISYHTEANGCIFFAVGVKDPSTQAFEFQTESLYFVTLDAKSSRKPTGISALNIKDKKNLFRFSRNAATRQIFIGDMYLWIMYIFESLFPKGNP